MNRSGSEWDPNECVLVTWEEVLPGEKTVISHQKTMRLAHAIEFVMMALVPKWQMTANISADGETWNIDRIKSAFEKMRGSAI